MTHEKWLAGLAARARAESPPRVDVAAAVVAEVRRQRPEQYDPMAIIAGGSVAAAAIVVAYAAQMWSAVQDPIVALMASMNVVLQ
ncbi:MAG: hypothetical protein HY718_06185 [Planctomycetes bacterium]|nr:hypothetical protein [Planctomycetota bacterium]